MAEDVLVVGSSFDPSGLTRGLDIGAAALSAFQEQVRATASQFPALDISQIARASAEQVKREAAAMAELNAKVLQATRMVSGVENLSGSVNRLGHGFEVGRVGGRRLESALTSMTLAGVGVEGTTARITEALVLFAGANLPLLEVAAAIGVVVAGYQLLTKTQHEAAKAAAELGKELDRLRQQQKGPVVQAQEKFDQQRGEVERLSLALANVAAERTKASQAILLRPGDLDLVAEFNRLTKQQAGILKDVTLGADRLAAAQKDLAKEQAAAVQRGNDLVASLTLQSGMFGKTSAEVQLVAVSMDTELSPAQRTAAVAALNHIIAQERLKKALEDAAAAAKKQHDLFVELDKFGKSLDLRSSLVQGTNEIGRRLDAASAAADKFALSIREGLAALPSDTEIINQHLDDMRRRFLDVADAAAGVVQTATGVGLIGQNAGQAVLEVINLADALNRVSLFGASLGNVLGAVGAGIGIIGGLANALGPSAIQREHDEILKQNNQRLAELRVSMDASLQGLAGTRLSQEVLKTQNILAIQQPGSSGSVADRRMLGLVPSKELNDALKAAGLSLKEFAALVEQQTGLKILDSEGHLVAESWELARKAVAAHAAELEKQEAAKRLDAVAQAAQDAANRLQQMNEAYQTLFPSMLQLRDQLLGVSGDPIRQFQSALEALAFAVPDIAAQFNGVNLNDPAAREALRQKLLAYVQQILSGQLSIDQLGITPEAFQVLLQFLNQGADILDTFNQSVQNATKSLLNVPQGLNLTMLEFQAQRAGMGLPPTPAAPPSATSGGGGTGARALASSTGVTHMGDINITINQQPGQNSADLVQEVKRVLRRESMSKFGNPDRVGL